MSGPRVRSFSSLLDVSDEAPVVAVPLDRSWRAWVRRQGDWAIAVYVLTSLLAIGLVLGFVVPPSDELHGRYRRVSAVIGWTYFCSWSVSFYPQVLLNFRRKTSVGLSFDFLMYNVLAFSCYAAFTASLYWSKTVQRAYDKRHGGQGSKVQLNDAVFALHALFITLVTLAQVIYYDWRGGSQRPSFVAVVICSLIITCASVYAVAVAIARLAWGAGGEDSSESEVVVLNWLDFLYFLSYVKIAVTVLKYVPQAVLNTRRRSTKGWAIWNVILDFTGGLLSVVQLVLDCWNTGDWGGIRGYPVKFAIGFVSVFFDIVFMFQHYVLYPQPRARDGFRASGTSSSPLLNGAHLQDGGAAGESWSIEQGGSGATRNDRVS